jgi:hypothetical protein
LDEVSTTCDSGWVRIACDIAIDFEC